MDKEKYKRLNKKYIIAISFFVILSPIVIFLTFYVPIKTPKMFLSLSMILILASIIGLLIDKINLKKEYLNNNF